MRLPLDPFAYNPHVTLAKMDGSQPGAIQPAYPFGISPPITSTLSEP